MVTLAMPPPFTHGLQAILLAAGAQGMDQRGHQLGARSAKWVAERDGAAIDVQLRRVCAVMLQPGNRNGREGFVHFVQVDVGHFHAGTLQGSVGGEERLFQHDHRVTGGDGEIVDTG